MSLLDKIFPREIIEGKINSICVDLRCNFSFVRIDIKDSTDRGYKEVYFNYDCSKRFDKGQNVIVQLKRRILRYPFNLNPNGHPHEKAFSMTAQ